MTLGNLSEYYKQVLDIWYSVYSVAPQNQMQILRERLWMNTLILVDQKPIINGYQSWKDKGIIYIYDIINLETGQLLQRCEIENRYSFTVDIMKYNSLISAIPREWRSAILSMENPIIVDAISIENKVVPFLPVNCSLLPVTAFSNLQFSTLLIDKVFSPPTSIIKWCSLHKQLNNVDWKDIFILPYMTVRSTKIQTFQYKILNRIFPCGENLFRWKLKDTDMCSECTLPETLEHYFYYCCIAYTFWTNLETWIKNTMGIHLKLNVLDVLVGTPNETRGSFLSVLDYCILIGKWYLFKTRLAEKYVSFIEFLQELKYHVNIEQYLLNLEGKQEQFENKWKTLYEAL